MKYIVLFIIFIGFIGCSKEPSPMNNMINNDIKIKKSGTILGYVHLNNKKELIKITRTLDSNKENNDINDESILLTSDGFYPANYIIPLSGVNCNKFDNSNIMSFCKSNFITTKNNKSLISTAIVTVLSAGLTAIHSKESEATFFDEEKFRKTISVLNLEKTRIELMSKNRELNTMKRNIQVELNTIYMNEYNKYKSNLSNIYISQVTKDKSGFAKNLNIESKYKIDLAAPKQKIYSYEQFFNIDEMLHNYNSLKERLIIQGEKDKSEYLEYVLNSFSKAKYIITTKEKNIYSYSKNIEFNYIVNSPKYIPYIPNKEVSISIENTIISANLYNMVPNNFELKNKELLINASRDKDSQKDFMISFKNSQPDYISILSLSMYFNEKVTSQHFIEIEIAPYAISDSKVLANLLQSEIFNNSSYKNMTKLKAEKLEVKYGYAVKYKMINSNIEKTLYEQKSFLLNNIINTYLNI